MFVYRIIYITITLYLLNLFFQNDINSASAAENKHVNDKSSEKLIVYGGFGLMSGEQPNREKACKPEAPPTDFPYLSGLLCAETGVRTVTEALKQALVKNPVKLSKYPVVFSPEDLKKVEEFLPKSPNVKVDALAHFSADQEREGKYRSLYLLAAVGTTEMHIPYALNDGAKVIYHDNILAGVAVILLDISKGSETGGVLMHASSALAEKHLDGKEPAKPEAVAAAFVEAYRIAAVEAIKLFSGSLGKGVICGEGFCAEREMVSEVIVEDQTLRPRFGYPASVSAPPAFNACEAGSQPCATADCRRMDALLAHGATQALARAGRPVIAPIGMAAWTVSGERSAGVHFQLSDGGLELGKRITLGADGLRDRDGMRFRVRLREIVQKDLPVKESNLSVDRVFRGFLSLDWGKTAVTNGACAVDAAGETAWIGGKKANGQRIPTSQAKTPFSEPLLRGFNIGAITNVLAALGGK
jgi:hypothetical protein